MNTSCIFCKIIEKTIPAQVVYESEEVIAFLDIYPVHPGHVLIVPKVHAETVMELGGEGFGQVAEVVPVVARAVQTVTGCEGYTLVQNNGSAAGQVVPHVHLHLIPRWSTDGLRHWPGEALSAEEQARIGAMMRSAIQS